MGIRIVLKDSLGDSIGKARLRYFRLHPYIQGLRIPFYSIADSSHIVTLDLETPTFLDINLMGHNQPNIVTVEEILWPLLA